MSDWLERWRELKRMLDGESAPDSRGGIRYMWEATRGATPAEMSAVLDEIAPVVATAAPEVAATLALLAGGLVEGVARRTRLQVPR